MAVLLVGVLATGMLAACGGDDDDDNDGAEPTAPVAATATVAAATTPTGAAAAGEPDLAAVKAFASGHADGLKASTATLATTAQRYYDLVSASDFDYAAALEANPQEIPELLATLKDAWIEASTEYEVNEGIIAGVPQLSEFDVLLDAGPSGEEDPVAALDWTLELPDGTTLEKPGNYFHHLTEPAIWGTNDDFVGLRVDLDGDGQQTFGEALPEANLLLGALQGMDAAAGDMQQAVQNWQPTLTDVFTALVTMIPTMNEYFEQWKLSVFVEGQEQSTEDSFVAVSRLFDINGILTGLDVTYDVISPVVAAQDATTDQQIQAGFDELLGYVGDLYGQEQGGKLFSPEEADLFGSEAQSRATTLTGQVTQAAALLGIVLEEG
jgi:hypothetical protein